MQSSLEHIWLAKALWSIHAAIDGKCTQEQPTAHLVQSTQQMLAVKKLQSLLLQQPATKVRSRQPGNLKKASQTRPAWLAARLTACITYY